MAVAVLGATALLAAGMLRAAWDAAQSSKEAMWRAQTVQAASSAAELHFAIIRKALSQELIDNIMAQGCRQTDSSGYYCVVPGNDTSRTSGIRRDRIQTLASQSRSSWSALQNAFILALRQVMPLAPEYDRYRSRDVAGFGGIVLVSGAVSTVPYTQWLSYGIVSPVQGSPITYDAYTRTAVIPFEVRAYGWASRTDAPLFGAGPARSRAEVTAYGTDGTITLRYRSCSSPDSICQYPQSVEIQTPAVRYVQSDPEVLWPAVTQ